MDLLSPVIGKLKQIETVDDEMFATKMLGDGVAILPRDPRIVSPADAEVTAVFPTGHAIGLKTAEGIELLLHLGIDTVALKGNFFQSNVQLNQSVKASELLVDMDFSSIKEAGYDTDVMLIITNTAGKSIEKKASLGEVDCATPILTIK